MNPIVVNKLLNIVMWASGAVASAALAGRTPAWLTPWVPLISLAGTAAAKWAKTPSQAIAAAVPPSKAPQPGAVP